MKVQSQISALISPLILLIYLFFFLGCSGSGGGNGAAGGAGNSSLCPTTPTDIPFAANLPSYIPAPPATKILPLIFTTAPMDHWGKSWNSAQTICEDSKIYVDSVINRSAAINAKAIMFSDFYVLNANLDLYEQIYEGAMTYSQSELTSMTAKAHAAGLSPVILMTNIYGSDSSIAPLIEALHPRGTRADIDKLFTQWKSKILLQAQKATSAGVDVLVINPRDIYYFFPVDDGGNATHDLANIAAWQDIIVSVKGVFPGKIYFWGGRGFLINIKTYVHNIGAGATIDGYIVDEAIDTSVMSITKNTYDNNTDTANLALMKTAWANFFSDGNMIADLIAAGDTYMLLLASSYLKSDGTTFLQSGWIEPGAEYASGLYTKDEKSQALIYESFFQSVYDNNVNLDGVITYGYWWSDNIWPNNSWQRSDVSHSIRQKEAEQVFYKWSQVLIP